MWYFFLEKIHAISWVDFESYRDKERICTGIFRWVIGDRLENAKTQRILNDMVFLRRKEIKDFRWVFFDFLALIDE